MTHFPDIGVEIHGHVGLIEIRRPPLNFFDISLINQIADALEGFDRDIEIRASVLAAQGKAFCAGANFTDPARQAQEAAEAKGDPASPQPQPARDDAAQHLRCAALNGELRRGADGEVQLVLQRLAIARLLLDEGGEVAHAVR